MQTATDTMPLPNKDSSKTDAFLNDLLKQLPQYFDSVQRNRQVRNVQVIYTKVDRGANGIAALKHYYFNVNPAAYFYPAATVQFPISLLTLQKLNALKANGIDKYTTMLTEAGYGSQTAVFNDPTTIDGQPSIAHYLKKIGMTADADAGNRLYEFLGQQYLNNQLQQKGYTNAQIIQRLDIPLSAEENRHTNPVKFVGPYNKVLYQQPGQYNQPTFPDHNDAPGKAADSLLVNAPMDFSSMNRISLEDLHTMLVSLVFPNKVTAAQRFNITDEDRKFMLKYMSQLPTETTYPPYYADSGRYFPACNKLLLFGASKEKLPEYIRSFNTTSKGYGQLLEVAYIVDFEKKIEFFLSAVIYCNNVGTADDDQYDYDIIGYPFMKHLGQAIYDYEVKREKKIEPDLEELKFIYDKR